MSPKNPVWKTFFARLVELFPRLVEGVFWPIFDFTAQGPIPRSSSFQQDFFRDSTHLVVRSRSTRKRSGLFHFNLTGRLNRTRFAGWIVGANFHGPQPSAQHSGIARKILVLAAVPLYLRKSSAFPKASQKHLRLCRRLFPNLKTGGIAAKGFIKLPEKHSFSANRWA